MKYRRIPRIITGLLRRRSLFPLFCLLPAGFFAGVCNGLLGTGGGILLVGALQFSEHLASRRSAAYPAAIPENARRIPDPDPGDRQKDVYVTALSCMLPLSLFSVLLYSRAGAYSSVPVREALPYLIGAIPGGILGAYTLDRMKPRAVRLLFCALVLAGGARMAFS